MAGTSQCGAATVDDGSSSWTLGIRNRRGLPLNDGDKQKNPVPFQVRGWLLVAHPSYKLDQ